jgi:hypothetical protein
VVALQPAFVGHPKDLAKFVHEHAAIKPTIGADKGAMLQGVLIAVFAPGLVAIAILG